MPWVDFRKMCCRQVFPGACPEFQTPRYRDLQPLQLRPNREFWCVSPPKFGGDIGVSPGVQEGLMLIYVPLFDPLAQKNKCFLGWFQSCLKFSSFILMFCRWVETTTCNFMFRLVVFAARIIVWVGWVRVLNQQKSRQWFFLVYNERDSGWLVSPLQRCMSSSQPQLLLLRNLYLQNICYIFYILNFSAPIVVQYIGSMYCTYSYSNGGIR